MKIASDKSCKIVTIVFQEVNSFLTLFHLKVVLECNRNILSSTKFAFTR